VTLKAAVTKLNERMDALFAKRSGLVSVWQEIAEHFFPERADFTTIRRGSTMFDLAGMMTSVPALIRRDLGNTLSAMLRPRGQEWFRIRTSEDKVNEDPAAKQWLDWATDVQRKVFYDKRAHFVRATKEGDHDFASFGQCVLSIDVNDERDGLLYRCWHLRDVAWMENASLDIDTVARNWKVQARSLVKLFPDKVDGRVRELAEKEPFKEIKCRHIVVPADEWQISDDRFKARKGFPFVSLYVDCDNQTLLEETPKQAPRLHHPALADGDRLAVRARPGLHRPGRRAAVAADDVDLAGGRTEGGRSADDCRWRDDHGRRQHVCRWRDVGRCRL